jgi:hypothetical protein
MRKALFSWKESLERLPNLNTERIALHFPMVGPEQSHSRLLQCSSELGSENSQTFTVKQESVSMVDRCLQHRVGE